MGLCASSLSAEQREKLEHSKQIQQQNAVDFSNDREKIKLLLLGAGESGKSTIFKQMKKLYGTGFTDEEKEGYTTTIRTNTIIAMKAVVEAASSLDLNKKVSQSEAMGFFLQLPDTHPMDADVVRHLESLWADEGIQETWGRRAEFQVIENTKEYFNDIKRISEPDYLPTDDDLMNCRIRTSGIVEEKYLIDNVPFVMYDVGGQRNERKKWIHCFEDVNAVIFVAALSEYDQMLFEDSGVNRMVEAVTLFDEICNSRWFHKTSMILFMNKKDLFEKKIADVDIKSVEGGHFDDFQGEPGNYDDGANYFKDKFVSRNKDEAKVLYTHFTCATDSDNVKFVFDACKEIILRENLEGTGFTE